MTDDRGERKKYKIINRSATITVHICTVTIAIVHKCTILHPDVGVFWAKMCKKTTFFYFAKVYII